MGRKKKRFLKIVNSVILLVQTTLINFLKWLY